MADEEKKPKIVSDQSWKDEARKEKEKLQEQKAAEAKRSGDTGVAAGGDEAFAGGLPPANFLTIVQSYRIQSLYCLGMLKLPGTEQGEINLDAAKHNIDMLQVLEDKTQGNLSNEESAFLSQVLHEVRMAYVQMASPG